MITCIKLFLLVGVLDLTLASVDLRCWTVTKGQHYSDLGLDQAPFNDLDSCINYCMGLPQCGTVDMDRETSPQCWVQKKRFAPTRTALKPKASVTNYMLDKKCLSLDLRCWDVTKGQHYSGPGLDQAPFNDLPSCMNHCLTISHCEIVDIDEETSPKCWVKSKAFVPTKSDLKPKASVTNYILNRKCREFDLRCWDTTEGQHYTDVGLTQASFNDLPSCINYCLTLPQCQIVDLDETTSPKCWVQDKAFVPTKSALKPKASVTNYILNRKCKESDLLCWEATPGVHYTDQGLDQAPFDDQVSCRAHCESLPQCWLVDLDQSTNPKCWVQKKSFVPTLEARKPQASNMHYYFDRRCKSLLYGLDLSMWDITNRHHYTDVGLEQVQINNLGLCLKYCLDLPECSVVDFDFITNPSCWIKTKQFQVNKIHLKPKLTSINFILKPNSFTVEKDVKEVVQVKPDTTGKGVKVVDQTSSQSGMSESTMSAIMSCWFTRNDTEYKFPDKLEIVNKGTMRDCLLHCYSLQPSCKLVNFVFASNTCKILKSNSPIPLKDFVDGPGVASFVYNEKCSSSKRVVKTEITYEDE